MPEAAWKGVMRSCYETRYAADSPSLPCEIDRNDRNMDLEHDLSHHLIRSLCTTVASLSVKPVKKRGLHYLPVDVEDLEFLADNITQVVIFSLTVTRCKSTKA